MRRQPLQQNALPTSGIQHCRARLQMAYIARQYAEARKLGKLRKEVPPPCSILRFPGLRGLQQAIGPAAAVYEQPQPARRVFQKHMPTHALGAHSARSAPAENARKILWIMSALPILCYHNVATAPTDAPFKLLYVNPDRFERQLWTLRRLGLRGVSTSEGIARLRNSTSRGYVVLTFDDGYADTLTTAAPLIKRYGFGATCYVVSGAVGTYNRWDADYLRERKPLMSREQLDQWLAAGLEVGSHSLSHQRLHELPQDVARYEISESRTALRSMLGVAIEHFAYPFGHSTAGIVELVRRAGYSSAVTVLPGVARASDDQLRLPRILVNGERGLWNFLLHVATPYERVRLRRRAL
jgi:peptidoglycan/xylan/chitin deacetylase (PgdA/CDA1 family)